MNRFITATSALALTFAALVTGCEDKPAPAPAPAPTTPAATAASGESPKPADPVPAPAPVEAPKADGRASAAGTVDMFIAAMQKRDYAAALECLDPASEGYKNINDINQQISTNASIPPEAVEIVKNFLSSGYAGMTHKDLMEDGDRARVTFVPKEGEAVTCDMNKLDGKWFIIAPQNIVVSRPVVPPSPAPAPAPEGTPVPAPAADPAGNPK